MSRTKIFLFIIVVVFISVGSTIFYTQQKEVPASVSVADRMEAERSNNPEIEKKIKDLLSNMTLEEKIGQMTQINNSEIVTSSNWGAGAELSIMLALFSMV